MALKDEWKSTGKGLGKAFTGLGKNIVRTVETGVDRADAALSDEKQESPQSTVFNDGSWRKTGKDMGGAFANLGRSIIRSAKVGIEKADEFAQADNETEENK